MFKALKLTNEILFTLIIVGLVLFWFVITYLGPYLIWIFIGALGMHLVHRHKAKRLDSMVEPTPLRSVE